MTIKNAILSLIGIFLLLKLSYLIFSVGLVQVGYLNETYSLNLSSYADLAMKKDAFWYKDIAMKGYPKGDIQTNGSRLLDFSKGQSAWAFFPAYPTFNQGLSRLFSIRYEIAAFISSILFSIVGLCIYFLFCKQYWQDISKAFFGTLVLLLFPFHFYFSMFLTEAPFFAFLIGAFYAIQQKRLFLASLLLIPLVLIRPNGLLMLFPLYLFYLEQKEIPVFQFYKYKDSFRAMIIGIPALLFFAGYLFYQYKMTGHFMAFSAAQKGWNKTFTFPLFSLFRQGGLNAQFTSWYVIFISLLTYIYRHRIPWSFKTMILISLILPLTAGSTLSIIRYLSVVFPIFIIIAEILYRPSFKALTLCLLFVFQLLSFYLWLADYPLGF